jgi:hypothetical protein
MSQGNEFYPIPLHSFIKLMPKGACQCPCQFVDLLDSRRTGKPTEHFPNVSALRKYTMEADKVFPKSAAKQTPSRRQADGFLKDFF